MRPFGADHLGAVLVVILVIAGLTIWGRGAPAEARERVGRALGVLLLGHFVANTLLRATVLGYQWKELLPLHLCGALVFIGFGALWSKSVWLRDVFCIWTFAATLHSLITPTSPAAFPDLRYFSYFSGHGLIVIAAAYRVRVLPPLPDRSGRRNPELGAPVQGNNSGFLRPVRWRATWASAVRAFVSLNLFAAAVAPINVALDMNFLYLRAPPPGPTLFDALGRWPHYLVDWRSSR